MTGFPINSNYLSYILHAIEFIDMVEITDMTFKVKQGRG